MVCAALAVLAGLAWAGLARRWRFAAVRVLQAALALAALAVMLYTGLLLQSLNAVPLWATPWLPALFVLSSLSCGMALVLAACVLAGGLIMRYCVVEAGMHPLLAMAS